MLNSDIINVIMVIIIIAAIIFISDAREDFSSKNEKTTVIKKWFETNLNPTYTQYKKDIGEKSNIVEYEDALLLYQRDKFTVANIEKII